MSHKYKKEKKLLPESLQKEDIALIKIKHIALLKILESTGNVKTQIL